MVGVGPLLTLAVLPAHQTKCGQTDRGTLKRRAEDGLGNGADRTETAGKGKVTEKEKDSRLPLSVLFQGCG